MFVNDVLNREVLERLAGSGVRLVALRCVGFNNVDLEAAKELSSAITRVPSYSPHAVAELGIAPSRADPLAGCWAHAWRGLYDVYSSFQRQVFSNRGKG